MTNLMVGVINFKLPHYPYVEAGCWRRPTERLGFTAEVAEEPQKHFRHCENALRRYSKGHILGVLRRDLGRCGSLVLAQDHR